MKKVLLSSVCFLVFGLCTKLNAQCTISNVHITPKSVSTVNGTCVVTVDLDYTVAVNGGSKHTVIHLWESPNYPSPAHVASDYPLATAATAGMLGTIVLDYQSGTPVVVSSWPTGPGNFKASTTPSSPILNPNITTTAVTGGTIIKFTDLQLSLSTCNQAVSIKGDIWATQNDQGASCLAAGAISVVANDPLMRGLMICSTPRSFTVDFQTINATSITFSAYKDANGNGAFDAADIAAGKLNLSGGGIVGTATDVTVNNPAGVNTHYGPYTYDQQPIGSQYAVFVVARAGTNNYDNVLRIDNSCSLLPVSFKSFTASKANITNTLKWTTSFESNSKGFFVQRFYAGKWENLNFIASKAENGFSNTDLSYSFNDVFSFKGAVQYRIQQVDFDGTTKFSQICSLVNGTTGNVLIYPNPGVANGVISVVLPDANSTYGIQILDNTGRLIKEFTSVRNTQQVSSLSRGQYIARIKDENGQVMVEKFIVQ